MDCYGHLFPGPEADAIAQVRELMSAPSEALQAIDQTAQADARHRRRSSWDAKQCVPDAKECDEKTQVVSPKPLEITGLGDTQQSNATECETTPGGIRTLGVSCEKIAISERGSAESGALYAENSPINPDLQVIIERWEDLSEATKDHVVAMVRATDSKG